MNNRDNKDDGMGGGVKTEEMTAEERKKKEEREREERGRAGEKEE